MLPASNRLAGMSIAFPDICLTPMPLGPVPIPYTNVGLNAAAVRFSMTVIICGGNAFNLATLIAMSRGDEPGVAHPTFMGPVTFTTGCPKVIIEGTPGVSLLASTFQNRTNAMGMHIVPSATNVFYMRGGQNPAGSIDAETAIAWTNAGLGTVDDFAVDLLPDQVARLSIRTFSEDIAAQAYGALTDLQARGAQRLIVDVRGNPGGDVGAAISLAGEFLPKGSLIATMMDTDGDETTYSSTVDDPCSWPLEIWVDRFTASAAELFAGALQVHNRARVLGETTYGKGTVQTILGGLAGPTLHSVARVMLPNGEEIQGLGVCPDGPIPEDSIAPWLAPSQQASTVPSSFNHYENQGDESCP